MRGYVAFSPFKRHSLILMSILLAAGMGMRGTDRHRQQRIVRHRRRAWEQQTAAPRQLGSSQQLGGAAASTAARTHECPFLSIFAGRRRGEGPALCLS